MESFKQNESGNSAPVLVVSNATVDETYSVDSIPLPGQSLIGKLRSRSVGGKGANVATVLSRAGVNTTLLAGIGTDERSAYIHRELDGESLNLMLQSNIDCPTDLSLIYTDAQGENCIVTTVAATHGIDVSQPVRFMQTMHAPGWLVLQGNLSRVMTESLMQAAIDSKHRIVFNPSPYADWMKDVLGVADIVVLNSAEATALTGYGDELAGEALLKKNTKQLAITRGAQGALLFNRANPDIGNSQALIICKAVATQAVDTTGAGDTWLATALASAIRRHTWLDALSMQHAAKAAAITVSHFGTRLAFPDRQTMESLLNDKYFDIK